MFWSTFCCQILIIFNFLESLGHKETECTSFAKKVLQIICIQPVKRDLHIFVFLNYTSGYLKCCKFVLYISPPPPQRILVFKYHSRDRVNTCNIWKVTTAQIEIIKLTLQSQVMHGTCREFYFRSQDSRLDSNGKSSLLHTMLV